MFFTFTKNNGTGRDTLSLDIVNFREVILMTKLLSREVRLGYSPYLRFPCLYVECLCFWLIYAVTINVHRLLFLQFWKVKSKVCRLLSANRPPMSLNNFSEIYISHLSASAMSLRARSIPLLLLVFFRKRNANERLSLISILENFCQIKNVHGKEK